ncbi:aminotransferase class III-fold pyridoxal phosphate-dependent enzyme [Novosphingobium colocasiae]
MIRLYENGLLENGVRTGRAFAAHLDRIRAHPLVGDTRGRGMLGAIELVSNKATRAGFDPALDIGGRLGKLTWDNGVIVRCFANAVIGFAPALCCSEDEMAVIFERVETSLDQLLDMPDIRSAVV